MRMVLIIAALVIGGYGATYGAMRISHVFIRRLDLAAAIPWRITVGDQTAPHPAFHVFLPLRWMETCW